MFKKIFKERIDEKTLVLLSVYFLLPILIFWGLTQKPITSEFRAVFVYFCAIFITLAFAFAYALAIFKKDTKDRSIFLASCLVGNTGNLGIPLGIALFGIQSVPYTSIINIANTFFVYTFSVYFYAQNKFNLLQAIKDIFSIPVIPVCIVAIAYNLLGFSLNGDFERFLTMGAYSAIAIQLIIFGIFISQVKVASPNWHLGINTSIFKHIVLPLVGFFVLFWFDIDPLIKAIIFLELCVPLAINNINLSSLFNRKPLDTTFSVLLSFLVFVTLTYGYIVVIKYFFIA